MSNIAENYRGIFLYKSGKHSKFINRRITYVDIKILIYLYIFIGILEKTITEVTFAKFLSEDRQIPD